MPRPGRSCPRRPPCREPAGCDGPQGRDLAARVGACRLSTRRRTSSQAAALPPRTKTMYSPTYGFARMAASAAAGLPIWASRFRMTMLKRRRRKLKAGADHDLAPPNGPAQMPLALRAGSGGRRPAAQCVGQDSRAFSSTGPLGAHEGGSVAVPGSPNAHGPSHLRPGNAIGGRPRDR